jgi:peptidyl-prolyl cis-trans isomerase A (cyclophilin A)
MVARLFNEHAPYTISHLKALAEGQKPWRDPHTGEMVVRPLYDQVLFHRVVPGAFIQTGDPSGTGKGNPGIVLPDEKEAFTRFDRPGLLGMANWGPGTAQSQFFITLSPQSDLDGRHAIFGELIEGLDVASAISRVPRDEKNGDRPLNPPRVKSLRFVSVRP